MDDGTACWDSQYKSNSAGAQIITLGYSDKEQHLMHRFFFEEKFRLRSKIVYRKDKKRICANFSHHRDPPSFLLLFAPISSLPCSTKLITMNIKGETMIIDMTGPKRISKPLSLLERFKMIKGCFDDDAGVNALLRSLKSEESKGRVLNHYYAYIAAADRDKHKYIFNLVHVLVDPQVSKRLDANLPELYVCR